MREHEGTRRSLNKASSGKLERGVSRRDGRQDELGRSCAYHNLNCVLTVEEQIKWSNKQPERVLLRIYRTPSSKIPRLLRTATCCFILECDLGLRGNINKYTKCENTNWSTMIRLRSKGRTDRSLAFKPVFMCRCAPRAIYYPVSLANQVTDDRRSTRSV